jgi:hypothetical protein
MSIENGARFIRRLRDDKALRERTLDAGADGFLAVTAAAGASASAYDVVAALVREIDAPRAPGKRLVLVGLVEPKGDDFVAAFEAWYLGNHVEDTYNCPNVKSVRCFRAERGFFGKVPSRYLTVYEFEGEDAEQAEKVLARYQADPGAWAKREPNNGSMAIVGAGWYSEALSFGI